MLTDAPHSAERSTVRSTVSLVPAVMQPASEVVQSRPRRPPDYSFNSVPPANFDRYYSGRDWANRANRVPDPNMRGGWDGYRREVRQYITPTSCTMGDWSAADRYDPQFPRPRGWHPCHQPRLYCMRCKLMFHSQDQCRMELIPNGCRKCGGHHRTGRCNITPWVRDWINEERPYAQSNRRARSPNDPTWDEAPTSRRGRHSSDRDDNS